MAHYKGVANDQTMEDAVHMSRCALNPETMQSKKYYIKKAKKVKNVAIVGGGIGGMEAARLAALRGHKVTIYEKGDKLGGVFIRASMMDFKEKDQELLAWYINQVKSLPIEVKFNSEVKDLESLKADEVIVATGAKARKLKTPGFENAIEVCDYLNMHSVAKDKVIVIGGGLTGCEIAYQLCLEGKHPTIVEMKNDLTAQPGVCLANSSYLREYFALHKVPVYLETSVVEIKKDGIVVKDKTGKTIELKSDTVLSSVGYISSPLFTESKHVHVVGDAYKVGNLRTVIWRVWDVVMKI